MLRTLFKALFGSKREAAVTASKFAPPIGANRKPTDRLPRFERLNHGWNADPNVPWPEVEVSGSKVGLSFRLNPYIYEAEEGDCAWLIFRDVALWRLGMTNDEGWFHGQCRYSGAAPDWGEFYRLTGEDDRRLEPTDWQEIAPITPEHRHFLFYLRDDTFECFATGWKFVREDSVALPST